MTWHTEVSEAPKILTPPASTVPDLLATLRRYWGYDSFRPLQERIVQSLLAGRDAAIILPTGGGKSLCYQLPAVVSGETVIVISPLIALMQDQVVQLRQMGIPAAFLNSAISSGEQQTIMTEAGRGAYRLIYLSPERLARTDTIRWLQRVPIAFFAIDEAHCISEWGHEFRPEYRQLSSLRLNFPDKPIAAFTASATRRVRHDILAQLQLREPDKYILSFHRPNLRYLVKLCEDSEQQSRLLLAALRAHAGANVIVYAPTIARVEDTVDFLEARRIAAVPYHGQMDAKTRKRNQERWMSDEVRVLVGTIAFGLGINKPGVRAVIHTSLPKSVEQYYQEAGRAGRDGLPADCALLWQKRDLGLLSFFIQSMNDAAEQQRAWTRYREVLHFAEAGVCRHRQICLHFGETPKWPTCSMCDVCCPAPDWLIGTPGKKEARPEAKPRSKQSPKQRVEQPTQRRAAGPVREVEGVDPELFEYMREWRRRVSHADNVAAFMVLHDTGLEDLCRKLPTNPSELLAVTGIGEAKARLYGAAILSALQDFRSGARAEIRLEPSEPPAEATIRMLKEGRSFEEIAKIRERRLNTVIDTVAELVERGRVEFDDKWIPAERQALIGQAIARLGTDRVKTIKDALPADVTYGEIRLMISRAKRPG